MLVGLVGTVIPGLPGVLLVFAAAAVYAVATGFAAFGPVWLVVMGLVAAAATAFDFIAQPALARRFGASKWGVIGAGWPHRRLCRRRPDLFHPRPLAGAVLLELLFGRTMRAALRSGLGTAVGFVASVVVDATAALVMIVLAVLVLRETPDAAGVSPASQAHRRRLNSQGGGHGRYCANSKTLGTAGGIP
ncbi:MAG: DUF456 family protein [Dehalococcoidia bacterium]